MTTLFTEKEALYNLGNMKRAVSVQIDSFGGIGVKPVDTGLMNGFFASENSRAATETLTVAASEDCNRIGLERRDGFAPP